MLLYGKNLDIRHKGFANTLNLAPRHVGPYKIVEEVHHGSYKLAISSGSKVLPVFHRSLLKLSQKDDIRQQLASKVLLADGKVEGQLVEAVLYYH